MSQNVTHRSEGLQEVKVPVAENGMVSLNCTAGRLNHHVSLSGSSSSAWEDLFPDFGPGPAGKALVDILQVAAHGGQVLPSDTAQQHPQGSIGGGP